MSAKTIIFKVKKQVFAQNLGDHISNTLGDGLDFLELREYTIGEDIRHIDWKRSARMSTPYIKTFHKEKPLRVSIVPILTPTLHFGSIRLKQDIVAEIAAIFGYSALKYKEYFRFIQWENGSLKFSKFSKNPLDIDRNIDEICNINLLKFKHNTANLADELSSILKDRSLVILIGDFYDIINLSSIAKRHEVITIVVRDIFEESPKDIGSIRVINPDDLSQSNMNFSKSYTKSRSEQMRVHDMKLFSYFSKIGVKAFKIYTHESVITKLRKFMG